MEFFDFHHHKKNKKSGIYNLEYGGIPPLYKYSIGIHPKDIIAEDSANQLNWLKNNVTENCYAIGECGLDGLIVMDEEIQKQVFKKHIEISNEFKKPLIIHCVRKFYEVISFKKFAEQPMIIHGFNKKQNIADDLLKNNFYLSFGKPLLYNLSLQDVVKKIPLNKIFIETDDDDFSIEELYLKVSKLKEISLDRLQEQISENLETIKNG